MIFLIEYDKIEGRTVSLRRFRDSQHQEAYDERLRLELELNNTGFNRQVVILEADSEETIRKTHRRFFESFREIFESGLSEIQNSPIEPPSSDQDVPKT